MKNSTPKEPKKIDSQKKSEPTQTEVLLRAAAKQIQDLRATANFLHKRLALVTGVLELAKVDKEEAAPQNDLVRFLVAEADQVAKTNAFVDAEGDHVPAVADVP